MKKDPNPKVIINPRPPVMDTTSVPTQAPPAPPTPPQPEPAGPGAEPQPAPVPPPPPAE